MDSFRDELAGPGGTDCPERFFDRFVFNLHRSDATTPSIIFGAGIYPARGTADGFAILTTRTEQCTPPGRAADISSAACSSRPAPRPGRCTAAPWPTRWRATPRPRPEPPPVIRMRGTAIAGGSTFIQRNIAAERILGMPRG